MISIAAYFDESFSLEKGEYARSYRELGALIEARGAAFFAAFGQTSYLGGRLFRPRLRFHRGDFQPFAEPVEIDVVYKKEEGCFDETQVLVVNAADLEAVCVDKAVAYREFARHSPPTWLVEDSASFASALARVVTAQVVLKPTRGYAGDGILIVPRENALCRHPPFPFLVQSFIDTSGGVPGQFKGPHDYRVVLLESEPVQCYARTPPPGSWLASVASGGRILPLPLAGIPSPVKDIIAFVDQRFSRCKARIYSVDVGRDSDESWKIIEVNTRVALFSAERGPDFAYFQQRLAQHLCSA